MRWLSAARTHRGLRRRRNEDALLEHPAGGVFAVADGMGGHAAGHVASSLAVDSLRAAFPAGPPQRAGARSLSRGLRAAFAAANSTILRHAELDSDCGGMGTTLTVAAPLARAPRCVIAHIGDSRAYLYRPDRVRTGVLTQLTHDHTWVQRQVDASILTAAEARHHPMSSVISRVLGTRAPGPPDVRVVAVEPGDLLLLCSDGLTGELEDAAIAALLASADSDASHGTVDVATLRRLARRLIDAANAAGGRDNITVLLLAVQP